MRFRIQSAFLAAVIFAALLPAYAGADTISQISIGTDGGFSANGLTVMQISGGDIFTRATWGQSFLRIMVLLGSQTAITKDHGEIASAQNIAVGDTLDVDGTIETGASDIIITAKNVRDVSLEQESKTLSGTVRSVNPDAVSFVLANTSFGSTTVQVSTSTSVTKGLRQITFGDISVGDKILSASGTYNYQTNVLLAGAIGIYQDKKIFLPQNFQGTLKSISGAVLPANMIVTVGGTDYTVYLPQNASVLSVNKKSASLTRFVAGDTVRFYGSIRQTDLSEIDADTVRDLNF